MKKQTTLNRKPILWIKDCLSLAKPFWTSPEKYKAFALITLVIILNLAQVSMTVIINKWYNGFYDAIQSFDKTTFNKLIIRFCFLAFTAITFSVLAYYFRKLLEIKWRNWLTNYYIDKWFSYKAFYKTKFLNQISDNPDQRISDDINSFIVLTLDLSLGLLNSVVTLFSFVVILWNLSGNLNFNIGNHHITIYGYMLWAAVIYSIFGTYITFKIGKPLIRLNYQQQAYEAGFRYNLVRVREYSESIAFFDGEPTEHNHLMHKFRLVLNNFVSIIYRQMKIDIFGVGYAQVAIIFPYIVAAPRYFAKIIKLGDMMQISSAFGRVQGALSYFIEAYSSLSGWRATMDRLLGFQKAVAQSQQLSGITIQEGINTLELNKINLLLPNGKILAKNISLVLNTSDRLLIKGNSGCGKTTLLRTIAQLWPFVDGTIKQKLQIKSLFLSQKPYLPIDNLAFAISYPKTKNLPDKLQINTILTKCKLGHLIDSASTVEDWGNILSLGEQQRIAFCRILINKPDIVYLDESTSALDEETENELYNLLLSELPNTVIVSIAHRSNVAKWHNQILDFNKLVN